MSYCSPSSSYDYNCSSSSFSNTERCHSVKNRGTLSEKIGMVVVNTLSLLFRTIDSSLSAMNKWIFSPLLNHALIPLVRKISSAFNSVLSGVANTIRCFNDRVLKPIVFNMLTPIVKAIISSTKTTFKTLSDWAFIPVWNCVLSPLLANISTAFTSTMTRIAEAFRELDPNVLKPVLNNVLIPLSKTLISGTKTTVKVLNNWVFKPILDHVLNPFMTRMTSILKLVQTSLVKAANDLNRSVISPLWNNVLAPSFNEVSRVLLKTGKAINDYVLRPLLTKTLNLLVKIMKTSFNFIKPGVIKSAKILSDWIIKPTFRNLNDFFHGIYRSIVVGKEYSTRELEGLYINSLNALNILPLHPLHTQLHIAQSLISLNQMTSSNGDVNTRILETKHYFIATNCAMALFLAHNHSIVIEQNWIVDNAVSPKLNTMYQDKSKV